MLKNGIVITIDKERRIYDKGYVAVEGDSIVAVGPMEQLPPQAQAARIVDCEGHAVLPGLVDGHGHGGHCLTRTLGEHLDDDWEPMAEEIYYRCTDWEFWRAEGALAAAERLKFGSTTGVSMVGSTPRVDSLQPVEANLEGSLSTGIRQLSGVGCPYGAFPKRARVWREDGSAEDILVEPETAYQTTEQAVQRLNAEKLALEAKRNQADRDSRDKNNELLAMERETAALEQKRAAAEMEEKQILDKLWDTYELSHEAARQQRVEIESAPKAVRRIGELKKDISALGTINIGAIEEFQRVNERYTYLTDQRDDVQRAKKDLEQIIASITGEMKNIFSEQFKIINTAFAETFLELFGGGLATLELEDPEDILNCGIEIKVQPPGKALKIITLLSGGEKAFVAIALYFAILKVRPTPFVVMDEIEAALDDNNVTKFAQYMRSVSQKTQFIVITHRRGTMEEADVLYGVTMQEQGVSRMLTINLNDVARELNL